MAKKPDPRVGLGVLICKDRKVLVGRRKGSIGNQTYALPGGHLEFGETWEECASREVEEETGLQVHNVQFAWVTNTVMLEGPRPSHYVTIFMKSELKVPDQAPQNLEPDKCEEWMWVEWPNVPPPVFRPLQALIDSKIDPFLNQAIVE